jgi:ethanolamine utilization protein EutQ (cupin superfamily)
MKYLSKPVEIEAIQFTGLASYNEMLLAWDRNFDDVAVHFEDLPSQVLEIRTLEGTMTANVGDYIIKGTEGEFYPCKPSVFERKYEALR